MQERQGGRLPLEGGTFSLTHCTVMRTGRFEGHVRDALKLRGEKRKSIIH